MPGTSHPSRTPHRAPAAPAALAWRLLVSPPLAGSANMALDEALMERARATGECVLRVYGWAGPTLSLGRNQRARGLYDDAAAARLAVAIVRRPTGGRAVLHHREVTYSVTAPVAALGELPEAYAAINRILVTALRRLGVDAAIARPAARERSPGPVPCFESPSAGEIVAGGRKLVGSAQWRHDGALLQHGSILVEDDQPLATALLREPAPPAPPAATLMALLGRAPALAEVAAALRAALVAGGRDVAALALDAALRDRAARLEARYRDPVWTWRR